MIKACQTTGDFQTLLEESLLEPVLLFKHSTRCPISARAKTEYNQFAAESAVPCWEVLAVEQRAISYEIAQATGIAHQSPQAILFVRGKAVWSASHLAITRSALQAACAPYQAK